MNKNSKPMEKGELSFFKLSLQAFLKDSHPQLANDNLFIASRTQLAEEVYETSVREGLTIYESVGKAAGVLFENLHFSKYNTLLDIIATEFPEIPETEIRELALTLLPVCESIFSAYPVSDNFIYDKEFENLRIELTGEIALWLAENGIQ